MCVFSACRIGSGAFTPKSPSQQKENLINGYRLRDTSRRISRQEQAKDPKKDLSVPIEKAAPKPAPNTPTKGECVGHSEYYLSSLFLLLIRVIHDKPVVNYIKKN